MDELKLKLFCCVIVLCMFFKEAKGDIWNTYWWTYDGISGPQWWGLNPDWELCKKGKYQSPIDIKPEKLLFDPALSAVVFANDKKLNGNLNNTGNDITLYIDDVLVPYLNATAGPLRYNYHLHHITLHFGPDDNSGSEHTINGQSFPAELQIFAFNSDLYANYSQALTSTNGIVAFAIFLDIGDEGNEAFTMIARSLKHIPLRGDTVWISGVPLNILLPATPQYITYDGSLTQPGCQESVTWVIYNKPIYVLKEQLQELRNVNKEGGEHLLISGNIRPTMALNNRLLRTNINYRPATKACSMAKETFYEGKDLQLSRVLTGFCLCENKGEDQLRSNCEADQRICFRYTDVNTIQPRKTR